MMLDDYYIDEAGETKGPYSKAQLRSMWDHGLITADTQYWAEGMSDWYLVETLLEPESQGSQTYPAEIRAADTTARAVSPPEEAIPKAPVSTPQSSARSDPTEAQKLDARGSPPTLKCPKCATHIDPQARVCPACQFPIWEYYENKAKAVRTEMNRIRGSNDDYLLQFYKADSFGGCMPVALILGGIASFLWVDSIVGVGLVIIGLLCLSPRVRVLFDSVGLGSRSDYKMKKGLAAVRAQNT